jgi:CelD/BcsL family acetyltransferase involved in cellulose biosynthesis
MFVQKSRRYQETGVRDILRDCNVKEFYRRGYKSFGKGYSAQMSALLCNGQPVATHWGIVHQSRYYWLMPSFAGGEVAIHSPGRLLQEKLLQWCIANRMSLFDFTLGAEDYKKAWCDKKLNLYEYVNSKSLMGGCFLAQRNMLQAIKRNTRARSAATMLLRAWRSAISVLFTARKNSLANKKEME